MKYTFDHDLHIHSQLSTCSNDPEQTPARIFRYAEENNLNTICITDHFWDSAVPGATKWYEPQDYNHVSKSKPLPQSKDIRFLFGAETDFDKFMTVGLAKKNFDLFDFVIIPTTHLHLTGFTITEDEAASPKGRAAAWLRRLNALLDKDLPFHKIGIAHLTCHLIAPTREQFLETINLLSDSDLAKVFKRVAKAGCGIELNGSDMRFADSEADVVLRPYRIAKDQGCKFYLGTDSHHPDKLDRAKSIYSRALAFLDFDESDKFHVL